MLRYFVFIFALSCQNLSTQKLSFQNLPKDLSNHDESPLRVLSDRPFCAETKMHELDDEVTPVHKMFVRNNGIIPSLSYEKDFSSWRLQVEGEVKTEKSFTLHELKTLFPHYEYQLTLECGGNGRAGFYPKTKGHQWTYGAVSCALWKGVRLKDLLSYLGLKDSAVYVAYESFDVHPSGDENKQVISRGFPVEKALEDTTLLAFELNRKPLTAEHGAPLRIMCPGYPGSASGKWIKKIWVRDRVHDGAKMTGDSYRVPSFPVKPGSFVPVDDSWKIIKKMPVKSLITYPKSGAVLEDRKLSLRGFAWTGEKQVTELSVSYDYGKTWHKASLRKQRNPFAWQRWSLELSLSSKGYYEIWARAKDDTGALQPMVIPGWNPKGYLNNAMPRIEVKVL